jgi:polysaccharide biosynthesis transport protein
MSKNKERQMEEHYSIFNGKQLKGLIRRRWKLLLAVVSTGLVISLALSVLLPKVYVSKSTLLIDQQVTPENYKGSTPVVQEDRLQIIAQQILNREKLSAIIDQLNLYPDATFRAEREIKIQKMQESIRIKLITADDLSGRKFYRPGTVAFTLSYEGPDRETVSHVADALANQFVEKNIQDREERASKTASVLQQSVDQLKAQVDMYSKKLSDFRRDHIGELPESKASNSEQIARLNTAIEQAESNIRVQQDKKAHLQGQLAGLDPGGSSGDEPASANLRVKQRRLRADLAVLRTKYSEKHPDVVRTRRQIEETDAKINAADSYARKTRQLEELKRKESRLKVSLGPEHPETLKVTEEIRVMNDEIRLAAPIVASSASSDVEPENPVHANLRMQLSTTEMELKSAIQMRDEMRRKIETLYRKNENASIFETEYNRLVQDYDAAVKKHTEVTNKLMDANISKTIEETQQIGNFVIIERAQIPDTPEKPKRGLIMLVGLFISMSLGIVSAIVMENFDQSVKTPRELQNLTKLPVLSVLPYILTDEEREKRARFDEKFKLLVRCRDVLVESLMKVLNKMRKLSLGITGKISKT